jgi:hypothetical protein
LRDYIIIVSSLGGIFVEEDTGHNPVWGHRRWHVQAADEMEVECLEEYLEATLCAEEMVCDGEEL